jgi:hypothetical protein
VVGVVLGVAYGVVEAQGERETARAYLDVAREAIDTAAEISTALSTEDRGPGDPGGAARADGRPREIVTQLIDVDA